MLCSAMENVSSSSSPENSLSPKIKVDDGGHNNVDDNKPILLSDEFQELNLEKMEKLKNYEDEYTRRLMAKYFSKKNIYGGNIFDENIMIDDEVIKSSRWPCTRSYAEPVQAFEDHTRSDSATPIITSNGNHEPKKSD